MTTFTSQIDRLRTELNNAIITLIKSHGRTELEISDLVANPTFVIHSDTQGVPREYRVVKVLIKKEHIIFIGYNHHHETFVEIDSRHNIGARMVEWLDSVLGNVAETIVMK